MQAAREQAKTLGYTYQYQCPSCGYCPTCGRSRNAYFPANQYSYPSVIYSNIPSTTATAAVPATSFHNH